jgi:hypothetical protein
MNLLPHLWKLGVLGGRTFDVLVDRWPLTELQSSLDAAKAANPESLTLGDFRADPKLLHHESSALAAAGKLITPHRAIAAHFGERAWLLDWQIPTRGLTVPVISQTNNSSPPKLFLPTSPLGRKGIHELAAALKDTDAELLVLGSAREGGENDPLSKINWQPATLTDLPGASALILPAWIEHQPRIALRALAIGIPVIATKACGLPDHPLLHIIDRPDPAAIAQAIQFLNVS